MPETAAESIANGIIRGARRVIRLHPTWPDDQVARALGLRRDDMHLIAEARQVMADA